MSARYKCPRCNDQQLTTDSASQALCYPCGVARVLVSDLEYYIDPYLKAIREYSSSVLNRIFDQAQLWGIGRRYLSDDDINRCRRIDLAFEPPPVGLGSRELTLVDWSGIKYQMAFLPVAPAQREYPPELQQLPSREIDPKYHATVDEILRVPSISSDKAERRPNEATVRGTPGPLEGNNQRRGSPALNDPSTPGRTCPGSEVQAQAEGGTKGQA